ncbi:cation diffusion facilitator family transporter [Vulgatibacter incomptus]|uniref:Cobalt-zinc-cadmium resistance protein n=1 Tax=Vulgatibacter incomptus TaxID=1391653 RepID=A0A0K1PIG9_9BACT|nr:cation diffusion facilitator family transporter [Vulgatibacter incomptus]AKU93302.1 Cobalt-zinc-cadmium resistance protein [Vulgatibacter incomptus]
MSPPLAPTESAVAAAPAPDNEARRRLASWVSLAGGLIVFVAKMAGWQLTGSTALLSDGLESIVNVVAAGFAIFSIRFAAMPADRDHPYGHGKIEFLSAAFEGGLIFFAAAMIFYSAVGSLLEGPSVHEVDHGLTIAVGAGVLNLVLGWWVRREGRQTGSVTLIADGEHILSDVWTTAGVVVGLGLVMFTGIAWLDPLVALAMGLLLARTGFRLVRDAANALLDREDPELLERLVGAFNEAPVQGITNVHRLRAIRSGDLVHVDAHVFVPSHWTVRQAHEAVVSLERWMASRASFRGELALHLDPCHSRVCASCDLGDCPVRAEPSGGRRRLSTEEAVGPTGLARP